MVGDEDGNLVAVVPRGDGDGSAVSGIANGVAQQIRDGAHQVVGVGRRGQARRNGEFDLRRGERLADDRLPYRFPHVDRDQWLFAGAHAGFRERKQLFDQARHLVHLILQIADGFTLLGFGAAFENTETELHA
jgi:hypothetical protein